MSFSSIVSSRIVPRLCLFSLSRQYCQIRFNEDVVRYFEKTFNLPTYKVKSLMLQFPTVQNVTETQVDCVLETLTKFGIQKENVTKNLKILNVHEYTIQMRCLILHECGFYDVNLDTLSRYLTLINKRTLLELQKASLLPKDCDIWNKLKECFDLYPNIQNQLQNNNKFLNETLGHIRMEILKSFIRLKFEMSEDAFYQLMKTYPAIKHKSLRSICKTLSIVENELNFPPERILAHGFIFDTIPNNIMKQLSEVRHIGGTDIKKVLFKHPILLKTNYKSLLKMKEIFKNEGISEGAQQRCPEVFTLSTETVQNRIQEFKSDDRLKDFFVNPRVLKLIYHRTGILKKMNHLETINKRCSTIHRLLSNKESFNRYLLTTEDRSKGIDFCLYLNKIAPVDCNKEQLRNNITRHPFWTYIPLKLISSTYEYLTKNFDENDVFDNSHLLLYSVDVICNIREYINLLKRDEKQCVVRIKKSDNDKLRFHNFILNIKLNKLSDSQLLSLMLYLIEREYDFSGNGVWSGQHRNIENDVIEISN